MLGFMSEAAAALGVRRDEQKCDAALGERSYFSETALGVRAPPVCMRRVIAYPAHGRELSAVAETKRAPETRVICPVMDGARREKDASHYRNAA